MCPEGQGLCGDGHAPFCADMNHPFTCGGCFNFVSSELRRRGLSGPCRTPAWRTNCMTDRQCERSQQCVNERCVACPTGFLQCGTRGCINPKNSNEHCGDCYNQVRGTDKVGVTWIGVGCTSDTSSLSQTHNAHLQCQPGSNCVDGTCEDNGGCGPGQSKCDGSCTNLSDNNAHCGACGTQVSIGSKV